jgi:hypothetical protein
MDHEVLESPRMIAKLEEMNMRQENPRTDPETNIMTEPQKESEKVLQQMKEPLNDHQHARLSEIFKEKECLEERIGDFDIDYVLDEETHVNIMTKRTWEAYYDSFIRRNRTIQRKVDKPMWKAHPNTYECQWNFDKGRFSNY